MEIWKDIVGFEKLYQISSLGNVKSLGNFKLRKEKVLKQGHSYWWNIEEKYFAE